MGKGFKNAVSSKEKAKKVVFRDFPATSLIESVTIEKGGVVVRSMWTCGACGHKNEDQGDVFSCQACLADENGQGKNEAWFRTYTEMWRKAKE